MVSEEITESKQSSYHVRAPSMFFSFKPLVDTQTFIPVQLLKHQSQQKVQLPQRCPHGMQGPRVSGSFPQKLFKRAHTNSLL